MTSRIVGLGALLWRGLKAAWIWFRAWRRTRPFWGALWAILAGSWIIYCTGAEIGIALIGTVSTSAGIVTGGGLILFGAVAWFAPFYRSLCGMIAFVLALVAFPTSNLGGFLLGTVFGLLGGSMMWAWGEKRPRAKDRRALTLAEGL